MQHSKITLFCAITLPPITKQELCVCVIDDVNFPEVTCKTVT